MNRSELDALVARGVANGLKPRSVKSKVRRAGHRLPGVLVDASAALAHVERLHASGGMSLRSIAQASGVSQATLSEMLSGHRNGGAHSGICRESTRDALLAVQPEPLDDSHGARGARIAPHGVQRRLMALWRVGYPFGFMTTYLGCSVQSKSYIGSILRADRTHQRMLINVSEMYEKLRYGDPCDYGVSHRVREWTKSQAVRRGYPGPGCWDDDTIDNPEAIPEWTGRCGTMAGHRIHERDGIPLCPACIEADREDRRDYYARKRARNADAQEGA